MRTYKTPNFSNAFSNVKLLKKLRFFSVAEAHGLIYPRPSGENLSFAWFHWCAVFVTQETNLGDDA